MRTNFSWKNKWKTWFEVRKCFLDRLWCRILINMEGRVITKCLLTVIIFEKEKCTPLVHTKSHPTLSFLLFLCKHILYNLHIELMKIPMTHVAQTFNIPFVRYFTLATGTLHWIKEQLSSHTLSIANFARHLIGWELSEFPLISTFLFFLFNIG